jgi:hypothetical protein
MSAALTLVNGLNGWLEYEVATSTANYGGNSYLDSYDNVIASMQFPINDPRNTSATKGLSHLSRFQEGHSFWDSFALDPTDDFAAGRITFAAMMMLSGVRRNLAYVHGGSEKGYLSWRQKHAGLAPDAIGRITGMFLRTSGGPPHGNTISERSVPAPTLEDLRGVIASAEVSTFITKEMLTFWAKSPRDPGMTRGAIESLQHEEAEYTKLVVSFAAFNAGLREGRLSRVPLLEPRSITTDPDVIYPFVRGFWDAYIPTPTPTQSS